MKKLFTPLLLFLTVLLGGINALAEDEVIELTVDMFYTWTGYDQNAVKGNVASGQEFNVGNGTELGGGGVVCGNGSVAKDIYADLSGSSKLIIEGTAGVRVVVNMNRQEDDSLHKETVTIGDDGTVEIDLLSFPYVHINTIKVDWGSPSGVINSIKFVKPSDPLAVPKEQLKNQISTAKMYSAIAYTEDSFGALQTAISEGETALAATNATEESLGTALTNITDAITGLTLAEEYFNLTANMFKAYDSYDEPGEEKETIGAYELFKSTNNPYGTGGSDNNRWADLSAYDKLIVTFLGNDKPRVWMNRKVDNGQDGTSIEDSNMLDLQEGNNKWSTKAYTTFEQDNNINIFTVDLNKIKSDYDNIARLHGIKYGWGGEGIVSGMYLYKAADPLKIPKEALQAEIDNAKLYDSFAKTETSWNILQAAITAAEDALIAKDATADSLAAASSAITAAIEGLVLDEGYEYLTAEMYKAYTSYDEPGEGSETNGAYELFKSTNNPYGTGGSDNNRWADLSAYDKLIVTFLGNDKPRVWINRKVYDGQDGTSIEDSKMLDLQEGNGKWSTKAYTTFTQDNNLNIFTVDLNKIKADYKKDVVRLHGIKYGWGVNGIVTGMYLYTSTDDLELPLEALKNEIDKAKQCDTYLKTEESLNKLQEAIKEGEAKLEEAKPTVESVEAVTAKISEAIASLELKPGYSELTKDMFKLYVSVEDPGEGEVTSGDFKLFETTGQPFGVSTVDYNKWAELTEYDQLIVKTDGKGGKPRFLMNRLADGGQQGATMEASNMLDIVFEEDTWSAKAYASCEDDAYSIDLTKMIDDYGFARLNTIKSKGGDIYVTGMYLYKNPADASGFDLTFNIDDPAHVVIEVNGEAINDLKAGANEQKVSDRAKLSISPAETFKLTSVKANGEVVALDKDGLLTKTIVKNISFEIATEDADPLAQPKKELTDIIDKASLYDAFAKTEESFTALTNAIAAGEKALTAEDATEASLTAAGANINKAIEGLTLEEGYSKLTPEMFKQYASADEPGEGAETDCVYELFNTSRMLYGANNESLKWADLTKFDQLILTTVGDGDLPRFCMNDEVSTKFEINPYGGSNDATEAYQTVEGNAYIIDLKKIVNDHEFAHLHSIQVNGWGTGAMLNGMYLYKNPFVEVTEITLDKAKASIFEGETVQLTATVLPEDATEPTVTWSSSDVTVATVSEAGLVTGVAKGVVTITAKAGEKTAICEITVKKAVESVTLGKIEEIVKVGDTVQLTATVLPDEASDKTVTWSSDKETVATVDKNGMVTAIAVGEAVITATAGEKSATCKVIVKNALTDVKISKSEATLTNGETLVLTAALVPADAIETEITWSSSNSNVATVVDGNVKTVGVGSATITAKAGNFSATCVVTVYPQLGDADWSKDITTNDAIHIANYVVGKKAVPNGWKEADYDVFYKAGADVNKDDNVSISDASATVELALKANSEPAAKAMAVASLNEPADNLVIGALNASANGGSTVAVTLDSSMDYVALQADVYVPEGVNFEVKPGSRIADSHSFQYHRFDDSHVRVAVYTFSGNAFADNDEPLFEIVADSSLADPADISLVRILASDADANEYVLGSRVAGTTGVAALGFDSDAPVKVFDLNGVYVSDTMEGLQQGFYIVRQGNNAKKVRIR